MATTNITGRDDGDPLSTLFSCLSNSYRRRLLRTVDDRASTPIPRRELATALATWIHKKPRDQVTSEERQEALMTLQHVHLPKLDEAMLIEQDTDRDTVTVTDHSAFQDVGIREAIAGEESADIQSYDSLFAALADAHRRTILDVLSRQYQSIQTETLAREVVAKERGTTEQDVPPEAVEELLVLFRHVHLPPLSKAGLIEYDADERTVAYDGHPLLRVPWLHSQFSPDFRTSLTNSSKDEDIWTIEGRENIVSYGQSLCEDADEELFMMFTTTGLLEAGCLSRVQQAVDRGVDVYLGTCDSTVREFVQEHTPAVTLWEPQANWLDLPVDGENVGRLVFADREAVLIGTLGKKNGEGIHEERAITGEGADNVLVVLMRQMLGSKLDQFDEQSERIESNLPF
ncbi:DUF7344 domain-containing protein [Natronococcus zhouii]